MPAKRKKTGNKPIFEQHNTTTTMKKTLNDTETQDAKTIGEQAAERVLRNMYAAIQHAVDTTLKH